MEFILFSVMLGVGLAIDACAVSIANFLSNPQMKRKTILFMAILFGAFQFAMPIIGYFFGYILSFAIKNILPYISFIILAFLGLKMIFGAVKEKNNDDKEQKIIIKKLNTKELIIQAIATSLDALSVGFAISYFSIEKALCCSAIIGIITFLMAYFSVNICKKFNKKLGLKANIFGGIILIVIGIEILIKSFI